MRLSDEILTIIQQYKWLKQSLYLVDHFELLSVHFYSPIQLYLIIIAIFVVKMLKLGEHHSSNFQFKFTNKQKQILSFAFLRVSQKLKLMLLR